MSNNLLNLDIRKELKAVGQFGYDLDEILELSEEPGLGNGGLGRLAACYMESMATLKVPATGYGIRYKYGIFKQTIRDNQQVETTDNWLHGDWHGKFVIQTNQLWLDSVERWNTMSLMMVIIEFVGHLNNM